MLTLSSRPGRPPKRASDFMAMTPSHDAFYDLKKRHLESVGGHGALLGLNGSPGGGGHGNGGLNGSNGMFPNGHIGEEYVTFNMHNK